MNKYLDISCKNKIGGFMVDLNFEFKFHWNLQIILPAAEPIKLNSKTRSNSSQNWLDSLKFKFVTGISRDWLTSKPARFQQNLNSKFESTVKTPNMNNTKNTCRSIYDQ